MQSKIYNTTLFFKTFLMMLIVSATFSAQAQKIKTIGNKLRSGSSNNTFGAVKGGEVGIKMKAGKKPVKLLKLTFNVENRQQDSLPFKVNVYQFTDEKAGENLVKQEITGAIAPGKSRPVIDLAPYDIQVSGDLLVSIEWLKTSPGMETAFSIGLFNGGTYHKDSATSDWEKIPVAGVDFNMQVMEVKK
ncbi:hypothetical protein LT679_06920 [Mucilaginibacter roseus]|uniref:Lipid/polyisoprenoid-binding YceI-like domain-containing protein n=1 Tax=Mucilaginibacter roseus TaxID=1528868 RepID=A0ABS8TZN8_9SPHI|nr:hypothetical protein [Mucilaginibacter roseus]MCD8740331.1 hypothetical protein [Mucilaginibacter roseus]